MDTRQPAGGQAKRRVGNRPPVEGHLPDVLGRGSDPAARLGSGGVHPGPAGRRAPAGAAGLGRCGHGPRRDHRQPGGPAGQGGLKAIYLSGWQVAADGNLAGQTYPDQSLYPVNSVPQMVRRINNALLRADQISWSESAKTATTATLPTGWPRSSPTPKPDSAAY